MPVLSPVLSDDNSVGYSLGLKFKLIQVFKDGQKSDVKLIESAEEDVFYGLFDVEDTDFEIIVKNNGRHYMGFDVNLPNSGSKGYYIEAGKLMKLRALETYGKHLHFLSQSTNEGKFLVCLNAHKNKISHAEAAVNCSRIGFSAEVEKTPDIADIFAQMSRTKGKNIDIGIKTLSGKLLKPRGVKDFWRVDRVKDWIENKEGIPSDQQRLIFDGRQLEDGSLLSDCGVGNGSEIYLVLNLKGGGSVTEPPEFAERGVVCFGKKTEQRFKFYYGFQTSEEFELKPFTIELRMKSKYSLSDYND